MKVLSVLEGKLALSMKDCDQRTGEDLYPIVVDTEYASTADLQNPERPKGETGAAAADDDELVGSSRRHYKALEDYEKWEAKQVCVRAHACVCVWGGGGGRVGEGG